MNRSSRCAPPASAQLIGGAEVPQTRRLSHMSLKLSSTPLVVTGAFFLSLLASPVASQAQDLSKVKVQYRCGNYFRITNANTVPVTVNWNVYQTGDHGSVTLPAKWGSYNNSETYLNTPNRGSLQLSVGTAVIATKGNGGNPCNPAGTVGQWGSVFTWWPHVCNDPLAVDACNDSSITIHTMLLPNGKVLTFGRRRQGEEPVVWDPVAGTFTAAQVDITDEFCSGYTMLADGRYMVVGGHPNPPGTDGQGTRAVNIFDWRTNTWTNVDSMVRGRWYPTAVTLNNGNVLIVSGSDASDFISIPETYTPAGHGQLDSAAFRYLQLYPRLFVAPTNSGNYVFFAGEEVQSAWLNMANYTWTNGGVSTMGADRDYGSAVLYDQRVLWVGGGSPPFASAEVMDLSGGPPGVWRAVAPMTYSRRQMNATILANGKILATGGSGNSAFAGGDPARTIPELFDTVNETWTPMPAEVHGRFYHTTALLLPDGRLLESGSGEPSPTGYNDNQTRNAQIYSPSYLFNPDGTLAQRPIITSAPSTSTYGAAVTLNTPNAASITSALLLHFGAVTHAFNHGQRLSTLTPSMVIGASSVTVTMPPNANFAPPGFYLLFLLDNRGVPTTGQTIQIQ